MASKSDPLYTDYIRAKNEAWKDSGVRLSEADFMNTVDPRRKYTDANARYFMGKLREGEWSSQNAMQRSSVSGGQIYQVLLKNDKGFIVDSAIVEVPLGRSLYDIYQDGSLKVAAEKYVEARFNNYEDAAKKKKFGIESQGRGSLKGLSIAGLVPLKTTTKPVQIVRRK